MTQSRGTGSGGWGSPVFFDSHQTGIPGPPKVPKIVESILPVFLGYCAILVGTLEVQVAG